MKLRNWLPLVPALAFLGTIALAKAYMRPYVWTVAADGSGEFLDIQPAISAAKDGDTILVLPGSYSNFTVDKQLTLLGGANVSAGSATIQAAPGPVVVADMQLAGFEVLDCADTVTLDAIGIFGNSQLNAGGWFAANVERSADVRVVDSWIEGFGYLPLNGIGYGGDGHNGLRVDSSRVELTGSTIKGGRGEDGECDPLGYIGYGFAGTGGRGLVCVGDSFVHAAVSEVRGRSGGDITKVTSLCYSAYAGAGGDAAYMGDGDLVIVGGEFRAGGGGNAPAGHLCGQGGDAVDGSMNATLRRTGGATLAAGSGGSVGCQAGQKLLIPNASPALPDPALERLSTPVAGPGETVTLRIAGEPGAYTRLFLSTQPALLPKSTTFLELLLIKQVSVSLGQLPANGVLDHVLDLDPKLTGWGRGTTVFAQTSSIYPGKEHRLSNSVPLVLR